MIFKRICILFLFSLSTVIQANEVSILSPQDDSVLIEPNVPVTISITDPSQVDRVTYTRFKTDCTDQGGCLISGQKTIGTLTEAPFNFNFVATTELNDVNYNIKACVYFIGNENQVCDTANNLTIQHNEPTLILGRVTNVTLRRPLPDGTFPPEEPEPAPFPVFTNQLSLAATTVDDDGISSVKFYLSDGTLLGEGSTEPDPFGTNALYGIYKVSFDTIHLKTGWHRMYVESTDNKGFTARHDPNEQIGRFSQGRYYIENHYIPTNVYGRAKNYHLNLIWDGNEQDLGYAVYRKLNTETSFSYVGTTEYAIWVDDMPIGTEYAEYYVKAVYEYGLSKPSDIATVYPTFRRRR